MKRLTFSKVCMIWFFLALTLNLANSFTIRSPFLYSLIMASLGIFLLIYPLYPNRLEWKYDKAKCRNIIRSIAVIEIIFSFLTKTTF